MAEAQFDPCDDYDCNIDNDCNIGFECCEIGSCGPGLGYCCYNPPLPVADPWADPLFHSSTDSESGDGFSCCEIGRCGDGVGYCC